MNAKGDDKLYVYDGNGNLTQVTDEDGYVTEYGYSPVSTQWPQYAGCVVAACLLDTHAADQYCR